MKTKVGIGGALLVSFFLTFGHAYHSDGVKNPEQAGKKVPADAAVRTTGALLCAMLFPLYWSVHLMEPSK
jgi:hypothetical protein